MKIKDAAKREIIRTLLILGLVFLSLAACLDMAETRTPVSPTRSLEPDSYQFVLKQSLGRGIAQVADWAPDGNSFAVATSVQIDLYDAQTFEVAAVLDPGQWIKRIAYSPDSQLLAAGDQEGAIQIWEVASRKRLHKLVPSEKHIPAWHAPQLAFSSDSQLLLSTLDQTLYLWDVRTGKLVDSFPGYIGGIGSLAISPDKKVTIAASDDGQIYVRDISTRELLYPPIAREGHILAVLPGSDAGQFKTVDSGYAKDETTIRTWDVSSGEMLDEHLGVRASTNMVDITPTNDQIVFAQESQFSLWNISTNKILLSMPRQTGWLDSIAISPDGQKLITIGGFLVSGAPQIWDLTSQKLLKTLDAYNISPAEVVFSPDEKLVAILGSNQVTQIREVSSGRLLRSFGGGGHLVFSPDSQLIAYGVGPRFDSYDSVVLADAETGEPLPVSNFSCPRLEDIAFSPDGKTLALGGSSCDIQLLDIQTGKVLLNVSKVEGNEYLYAYQMIFGADGRQLFLGGSEPKVLDVTSGKTLQTLHAATASEIALSPDGKYLALRVESNQEESENVQIWEVASQQIAFVLKTQQKEIRRLIFSRDGRLLIIVGEDMELWDLWNGTPLAKQGLPACSPAGVTFSGDDQTLVMVANDGSLKSWRIEPNPRSTLNARPAPSALPTLTTTPVVPIVELTEVATLGQGYRSSIYRSPDGKLAAFLEEDGLRWFDAVSLQQHGFIEIDGYGPVVFSPNNKLAVVGGLAGAAIVDLDRQAIVGQVLGGMGNTFGYAFTSDSHFMAYTIGDRSTGGPYHEIGLWDAIKYEDVFAGDSAFPTLLENRYHTMSAPAISPDGRLVAAGHSDKRVYLWDLHTGKSYLTLEGHAEEVTGVDFSPNGKVLASGSLDGTIRLWEPATGKLIKVLTGFPDDIYDIDFNSDGRSLTVIFDEEADQAVALDTGKIKPVPTPIPDPLEKLQYQQGFSTEDSSIFTEVLFSPDGNTLALASRNVLLWDTSQEKLLRVLDNAAGGVVRGITFNKDGTLLAVASADEDVLVWEVATGEQIFHQKSSFLSGSTVIYGTGDSGPGLARGSGTASGQGLAFSPDQDLLAFGNDNTIEVWNVRRSEKVAVFVNPENSYATQLSFSEDGERLYLILNRNRKAQIWDAVSGTLIREVQLGQVDPNAYTAVALRASLFARNNSDGEGHAWIELWNLDEGTFIQIDTPSARNEPLVFSADGSLLAARIGGSKIYFWKTATGQLIYQTEWAAGGLSISHGNRLLATGWLGQAIVYDLSPITRLDQPAYSQAPTPQATATPLMFAWPTATPIPAPTRTAGVVLPGAIQPENASRVVEKTSFGNGTLEHLVWSPSGDTIVTAGSLGVSQYFLHDFPERAPQSLLVEKEGWTSKTALLPDGRMLATSADAGRIRVWEVATGRRLAEVEGAGEPAISPDGSLLVYLDPDGTLQTWDIANGKPVATLKSYAADSYEPAFSPDGQWVAAVQSLRRYADWIRVWDARTGAIVNALGGPDHDITDFCFSADGRFLIGAAGGSAWIWDLRPGVKPEAIQLYAGEIDGNLNVYPHTVTAAALGPDNQRVAVGTSEHQIRIYDRKSQQSLFELKGHAAILRRLSFSPNGELLASVDEDGALMIWDMAARQRIAVLDDHKGVFAGLVYRTDGGLAAWGAGTVWQIDPLEGTLQHATSIDSGRILAASPAGDLLAVYNPFQVSLVDAKNGQSIQTLEGKAEEPWFEYYWEGAAFQGFYDAAFSQDGRFLATAGTGGVWYYDTASQDLLQQLQGNNAQRVALSPDGHWLISSLDAQAYPVAVFDMQSGSWLFQLDEYGGGHNDLQSAFSVDGRWVGTVKKNGDEPSELIIYDVASRQAYKTLALEEDILLASLAFAPSGNLIAAGTAKGEILLIDFHEPKILATLTGHHAVVTHLVFSPDGRYLASASMDGTVRTWGLP